MTAHSTFKRLYELLPDIAFHAQATDIQATPHYKTALAIFNFLCSHQRNDGAIVDPLTGTTLDGQYHQAHFVFSAIFFYLVSNDQHFYERGLAALSYFTRIPLSQHLRAIDFSNFPLLLGALCLTDIKNNGEISELLDRYIAAMVHRADITDAQSYGNNFIPLRAVNHLLRHSLLGDPNDKAQASHFIDATLHWQFQDGIFYDYPRAFHHPDGIPSLTYHAKITLMVLLYGLMKRQQHIIDHALAGLDALTNLMAEDGEAFYYGRSNNALYGYACGIFAFRLSAGYLKTGEKASRYARCASKLFAFATKHQACDGHLYIVPNTAEKDRCGFDGYMYVTVYNAFMMSMLLLSALIKDITTSCAVQPAADFVHFADSGFVLTKGLDTELAINVKGHNYNEQYLLDPRYTCGTPLLLRYRHNDMVPTIPFSYPKGVSPASGNVLHRIVRTMRRAFATARRWEYLQRFNPLHAGFLPCIEKAGKLYMPLRASRINFTQGRDMVCIMLSGNLTKIVQQGVWPLTLLLCEFAAAFMNVPLHQVRRFLVRETSLPFERTLIIGKNFLHFLDRLPAMQKGKYFFTFRIYATWEFRHGLNHAQWLDNGFGIIMPLQPQKILQKYATLGSSKGWCTCWKITETCPSVGRNDTSITCEHSFLFFDSHTAPEQALDHFRDLYPTLCAPQRAH